MNEPESWRERCPLRQWRARNGLTRVQAAKRFGVSMMTIQNWEHGAVLPKTDGGELNSMRRITMLTGISRDAWMTWYNESETAGG